MNTPSAAERVHDLIELIPDFPSPGILFRDLTPVFADGPALMALAEALVAPFEGRFDYIGGLEARGFLLAGAASAVCGKGVLTVRKAGKLPRNTIGESYALEYGEARLEVHAGQLPAGSRVLIVDDLLATGGTAGAAARLVERAGWHVTGMAFALELNDLPGRQVLSDYEVFSLLNA
ncbi:adenine phosphoribosyltransferase [Agromyces atrinae]|uniref:Adenine phosphoribosyltransferase n=1 Tax=Agromyces atrinae TaxID=592376 RepID=A0A4V1R2M2_9MICO|nr:adenine phosphoribosyltransferase [Agromyces atrinae]MCI2956408.1 adenine phosphoribosyltransferase [Agromyces atrinae]NYD68215.1 adenine phosphoribosyltransferase [Agromyces atrinae]RXZ87646.1 adenine phosphoribosyltransferase [Agromyces atrinae]